MFVYAICHGPTGPVVTGRIPGTMFVYTESLTHPNNQPLWAFLIPTQSQWSQVELATGEIRYSNTGSWSTSRGLSFPHPLSPFVSSIAIPNVTRIWSSRDAFGSGARSAFKAELFRLALPTVAGQLNFCFFLLHPFFLLRILAAQHTSQSKLPWSEETPTRSQRNAYLN